MKSPPTVIVIDGSAAAIEADLALARSAHAALLTPCPAPLGAMRAPSYWGEAAEQTDIALEAWHCERVRADGWAAWRRGLLDALSARLAAARE